MHFIAVCLISGTFSLVLPPEKLQYINFKIISIEHFKQKHVRFKEGTKHVGWFEKVRTRSHSWLNGAT